MTLPDPRERPTISVPEAGAILGLGRSAAYVAARAGTIPTIQVGSRMVVPTAQLLEMLDPKAKPNDDSDELARAVNRRAGQHDDAADRLGQAVRDVMSQAFYEGMRRRAKELAALAPPLDDEQRRDLRRLLSE